jgi:hypothetical protein
MLIFVKIDINFLFPMENVTYLIMPFFTFLQFQCKCYKTDYFLLNTLYILDLTKIILTTLYFKLETLITMDKLMELSSWTILNIRLNSNQ